MSGSGVPLNVTVSPAVAATAVSYIMSEYMPLLNQLVSIVAVTIQVHKVCGGDYLTLADRRLKCFSQQDDHQVRVFLLYIKKRNQSLILTTQVRRSVTWLEHRFLKTLEDKYYITTYTNITTEYFVRSLDFTSRLSAR